MHRQRRGIAGNFTDSLRSVASLPRGYAFVEADRARAEIDHVKKAAGHDEVLVKVHHVVHVAGPQMHTESGAEAEQHEQGRGPMGLVADQNRQTAEKMNRDRDPDSDVRHRNIEARKIVRGARRIAQLEHAIPDEQAAHQQAREHRQVGIERGRGGGCRRRCGHSASPAIFGAIRGVAKFRGAASAAPQSRMYRGMIVGEWDFDNARHERGR
jgi:hypothetical protein